jgi:serine/threonine protein kinase
MELLSCELFYKLGTKQNNFRESMLVFYSQQLLHIIISNNFILAASLRKFDEPTARHYFHQLINGLEFCHSKVGSQ